MKQLIKTRFIELYCGIFSPHITYHIHKFDRSEKYNTGFVISLIFLKLYISLPFNHYVNNINKYDTYGIYCNIDNDALIFQWGYIYKTLYLPWKRIITERKLLSKINDNYYKKLSIIDCIDVAKSDIDKYMYMSNHHIMKHIKYKYCVMQLETRPIFFKHFNFFNKNIYEVYVEFEKPYNGKNKLVFNTDDNLCIKNKIDLHIMLLDDSIIKNLY